MKRIFLIDCPGIVPPDQNATSEDILLRGVVRTEKGTTWSPLAVPWFHSELTGVTVENPAQYIPAVLSRVKTHHLARTYGLKDWDSPAHFLEILARKSGRLLKAGEADLDSMARTVLNDFLRGRIPWFTPPPASEAGEGKGIEGRAGRLGEMRLKRKRDDVDSVVDASMGSSTPVRPERGDEERENPASDEDDFEGFGSDSDPGGNMASDDDGGSDAGGDSDDIISLGASSDEEDGSSVLSEERDDVDDSQEKT